MSCLKIRDKRYGEVAGYLYRKTKPEQLTLNSTFPCVVKAKKENLLCSWKHKRKDIKKAVIVVALMGNQTPERYLNCKCVGYPHHGMYYASYEIIGYPIIDKTTEKYIRTKPWKNYHKRGIVAIIGDIVKSIKKRIE
jgi:hypothetical protein